MHMSVRGGVSAPLPPNHPLRQHLMASGSRLLRRRIDQKSCWGNCGFLRRETGAVSSFDAFERTGENSLLVEKNSGCDFIISKKKEVSLQQGPRI